MGGSNNQKTPISEINVTPMVDVMLVLLIIFMISAPLLYNGIKLDLPKTKKVHSLNLSSSQVILSISKAKKYFIGKDPIAKTGLVKALEKEFEKTKDQTLFLRADFELNYGEVAKTMSFLKRNGFSKIALVTEIEK
jgi:biopolymer transport protein ExbD